MRLFRKQDKKTESAVDIVERCNTDTLYTPRVEGDVVYDEHGKVLFSGAKSEVRDAPQAMLEGVDFQNQAEALASAAFATVDLDSLPEPEASPHTGSQDILSNLSVEFSGDAPATETIVSDVGMPSGARASSGDTVTIPAQLMHKRVNISELRVDVARISSDIQSGERLYQRAQQRVDNLMGFVERAEVDFSLLNRLEPENRRLKARNRVLEAENEASEHQLGRMERELAEASEALTDSRGNLEATSSRLSAAKAALSDRDREIMRLAGEMEQTGVRLERTQTSLEVESRENVVLRDQLAELSTRLDDVMGERMELAKIVESLKIDCDDFRAQREQASGEVSDLRAALATAHKINGEMKAQMVSLHEEIKGFKTQYEFSVISREDRIANLENRIADLTKQVSIKEETARSALDDVAQLRRARSAQDLERERLERVIESQQRSLDDAQAQIQRSTDSMAELDSRHHGVASALEAFPPTASDDEDLEDEDVEASPAQSFVEIAASQPVVLPDAVPAGPTKPLTPETIEGMIMDYKLGLRTEIG